MRTRYGYDEDTGPRLSELQDSHDKLRESVDKLGELLDSGQFPFADGREYARRAMKHAADIRAALASEGGEDVDPETDPNDLDDDMVRPSAKARDGDAPFREPQPSPSRILAIGATPPRAAVSLSGARRDADHRDDFRSGDSRRRGRGAHDSALPRAYDIDDILQRK